MQPEAFPFEEEADRPVVYYRIREVMENPDRKVEGEATLRHVDPGRRTTEIDLHRVLGIDLDGVFLCCRAVVPAMIEAVKAKATLGEISDRLRAVWGEYREIVTV